MKHIILIGFMGSGKTTVGMQLAEAMELPFIDMDSEITKREGMAVTEIFAAHGEGYFRDLETQLLKELSSGSEPMVISAGGGMPVQPQNHSFLKQMGTVILLETSTDVLVKRLEGDTTRPVLMGGDLRERILELQQKRAPVYEQVSDAAVNTDRKTIAQVVQEIQKLVPDCKK